MPDSSSPFREPLYPRTKIKLGSVPPDKMQLPTLFSNQSPWNRIIEGSEAYPNGVISDSENHRIMLVAFDVMRELSWEVLAKDYQKLDELESMGPQGTSEKEDARQSAIDKLRGEKIGTGKERKPGRISRLHAALKIENGQNRGGNQTPHIECVDYAFPIYPVERLENGDRVVADIPMETYGEDGERQSWRPAYSRRRNDGDDKNPKWVAERVPSPDGDFRPAAPVGNGSDGAMILYDPTTHEEWDFWQVTSSNNPKQPGGGRPGTNIIAAGSLARFDTQGLGTRLPPDCEPLGSSRATGLPYLGGLLVPEDFLGWQTSVIQHALAFAFPRSRFFPFRDPSDPPNFIYPAVDTEKSHFIQNPLALAAGMRIRLKSVIRCADGRTLPKAEWAKRLPPVVCIFLTALHHYGAYLVDGAFGFGFAAEDRETAVIDHDLVQLLTKPPKPIDPTLGDTSNREKSTAWDSLLQTIDEYLTYKLFPVGEKRPDGKSATDNYGLSLGCLNHAGGEYAFWTNFEVVAPLDIPR